jgi:sugar phosphate isomerase/epimerase
MAVGGALGTHLVRIFSLLPSDMSTNAHYDQHVPEAAERLAQLAKLAEKEGFTLVLENEKGIVTDTPDRCLKVLELVNSPALRFAWDPANFVQVGVEKVVDSGWAGLAPYIGYIHIKDARLADGKVTPAGEGMGRLPTTSPQRDGYQGTLSLEPRQIAGHSSGFSGARACAWRLKRCAG